jgi:glycosyltransferase involved in cell wall biosynthesis
MKNVVFFCRYFHPHIGGVEKHVFEVSKRLIKKGWTVTVVTELSDPRSKEKETYQGIIIYRIELPKDRKEEKYAIWNWFFLHRNLIKKADIIHIHDVFFWYLPFRFIYPFKRVYMTFHGYEGDKVPSSKNIFMHKMGETLSKKNICVGDYLKKWYKTAPDGITYGAATTQHDERAIRKKRVKEIVFIGRLDPEAGILRYLEVLNELKQQGFLPHLSVLGDGALSEQAKIYARRHRLNVTFFGAVHDVGPFLSRADCVFTSRFLSTYEAFASKKYVFCLYNNPIHGDCFLLSPFRGYMTIAPDVLSLTRSCMLLIEHPHSKDEEIEKAYNYVKKETWDKMASLYLSIWK